MPEQSLLRFSVGDLVIIKDLKSSPENNGKEATILQFLEDKQRYEVELKSGAKPKIKPENLDLVQDTPPTPPAKKRSESPKTKPDSERDPKRHRRIIDETAEREKELQAKLGLPSLQAIGIATLPASAQMPREWVTQLQSSPIQGNLGNSSVPRGAGIVAFRLSTGEADGQRLDPFVCIVEKAAKWRCKCGQENFDMMIECRICQQPRPSSMEPFETGFGRSVPLGFPKGGMEAEDQGSLVHNALREWMQETGIAYNRLHIIIGKHFDDSSIGARHLLALCTSIDQEPDSWTSPEANMECRDGHKLVVAHRAPGCAGTRCRSCGTPISPSSYVVGCTICVYSLCKKCKDPDPIVKSHWMPISRARSHLKAERLGILDAAIKVFPASCWTGSLS